MKSSDWMSYHTAFCDTVDEIEKYIKKNYYAAKCKFTLAYTTKTDLLLNETLKFNIGLYVNSADIHIVRDLEVEISPLLFVKYNQESGLDQCENISSVIQKFKNIKLNEEPYLIQIIRNSDNIFSFKHLEGVNIDDVGLCKLDFEDLDKLSTVDASSPLLNVTYTAVGVQYRAPYSNDDINCILFAQKNNPYDSCAIEILRWFPHVKTHMKMNPFPHAYEYGYISRTENTELHEFMMRNNYRILFGSVHGRQVQIFGGISAFKNELKDYVVPKFLLDYIS